MSSLSLANSEIKTLIEEICPYCKSGLADSSLLAICEACRTAHHLDCWKANNQCSIFGCQSSDLLSPTGRHREPLWLIVLRCFVLGTYPITAMANLLDSTFPNYSGFVEMWLMFWIVAEAILVPVFLIAELYCLWAVLKRRHLPRHAGSVRGHLTSLSIFILIVLFASIKGRLIF
jgi:hypothetical protein